MPLIVHSLSHATALAIPGVPEQQIIVSASIEEQTEQTMTNTFTQVPGFSADVFRMMLIYHRL